MSYGRRTRVPTPIESEGKAQPEAPAPGRRTLTEKLQMHAAPGAAATTDPQAVRSTAAEGLSGASSPLPHLDTIQKSFGKHDVSDVTAAVGGGARTAAAEIGAEAYASGDKVAFQSAPSLHLAAHEAAHVVQQRGGADVSGGVGKAGDSHEQHADKVADAVVSGRSAEHLLDGSAGGGAPVQRSEAVQMAPIADPLQPGEDTKSWSVDQYVAMWEKQQGRKMTDEEKETLSRGCIGISTLNLGRGNINPPLDLSFSTFEQAQKVAAALNEVVKAKPTLAKFEEMVHGNATLKDLKNVIDALPSSDPTQWKAVIFSKRFYSNQNPDWDKRKKGDPKAFKPDKHGQVDMTGYNYEARPDPSEGEGATYVNFDYGWYDEDTGNWWHANHAEPGMKVYQSTLEHYSRPLLDFDRQIFVVAFARKK